MIASAQTVFATWLHKTFPNPAEPVAVAFSGGGDSLALLLLVLRHAGPRPVYALSVDHALQEDSAQIIAKAVAQAQRLGAIANRFYWHHGVIKSGVQDAARRARYGLMGEFCRTHGIDKLLVGHSRDDQAETLWMRKQCGGGWRAMAGMSAQSYAPVWPQLRDLTLVRPLLEWSRNALRAVCTEAGEAWHDDPANENLDYLRVQARAALEGDAVLADVLLDEGAIMRRRRETDERAALDWTAGIKIVAGGGAIIPLTAFHSITETALARLIMCVSGQPRMADMARIRALISAMGETDFTAQTLGGCIIAARGGGFVMARETGRWLSRGSVISLPQHNAIVFDGRWEMIAARKGLRAAPLWPARHQLSKTQRAQLHHYDAAMRRGLFGVFDADMLVATPFLTHEDLAIRNVVESRLIKASWSGAMHA